MELIKPGYEIMACSLLKGNLSYKCTDNLKYIAETGPECHALTVKFICDRGMAYELLRYRPALFIEESARAVDDTGDITFVIPPWVDVEPGVYGMDTIEAVTYGDLIWQRQLLETYRAYLMMCEDNWTPEKARSVLPNSLKTEVVITTTLPHWKQIINPGCTESAHPQIRELMVPLREQCRDLMPDTF